MVKVEGGREGGWKERAVGESADGVAPLNSHSVKE